VSIKVLPRLFAQHSLQLAMSEQDALHQLNVGRQPLPISASCWLQGQLYVRLSGAQAAVDAAIKIIGGNDLAEPECFWG
jgi:glycolate oxidase FAD binding subunit